MSFFVELNREGDISLYQQITEQVKNQICDGRLPPGTRLPTVRSLADELGVTRLTVQNAYSELQNAGWIEATVGRGTFVSHSVEPRAIATSVGHTLTPDAVINDILQINQIIGVRSMASASPDPELFPADEFWHCLAGLRAEALAVISYVSSQGDPQLRVQLATFLQGRGIDAIPDDILITNGVTQGLALVSQALARPGDIVAIEQPTYLGFLHTLKSQGINPVDVPLDGEGPRLDVLERIVREQRPRFFYTVPSFQNPTGICMSPARRRDLLLLAEKYAFLIVEDDTYAQLAYDGPPTPTLKSLDQIGSVIHIGSFSKLLMPGLRIGYVVAPSPIHEQVLSLRRAADLCGSPLQQRALAAFMSNGGLKRHLKRVLPIYKERRDSLVTAVRRAIPHAVQWSKPEGGFCAWLTLPRHHALASLQQEALQHGWAFTPGEVFFAQPDTHTHLRICFGNANTNTITAGVNVLGDLIRQRLAQVERPKKTPTHWEPLV